MHTGDRLKRSCVLEVNPGCGEELAYWMGDIPWKPKKKPDPNAKPPKPAPPMTVAALPAECRAVAASE